MKILRLTLKRHWFDLILDGEKLEEYREIKPYWTKRLTYYNADGEIQYKEFTLIIFKNGYGKNAPWFQAQCKGITDGVGYEKWGAPTNRVYIIKLGRIYKVHSL